jgi:dTDP-L-rhamnose 4-epimerase
VERLVVASSMSLYGEGLYRAGDGKTRIVGERTSEQLRQAQWDWVDDDGAPLVPIPTPEDKPPALASVYALSKFDQEKLCLMIGRAYRIPTVALRFFNAYGPRQALSNPYTGVLAIFASRLLNGNRPLIFEDGNQMRDFVSARDIAQACVLALQAPDVDGQVFNVGSGEALTVREIAARMARTLGKEDLQPEISGKYRVGDIRHCFADLSRIRRALGYRPQVTLEAGLEELAQWLAGQRASDRVMQASAELSSRGLTV